MKHLFLIATAIIGFSIASTAVIAGHHEDGEGKGHKGKMMEKIDTDGDGSISKAEFMAKHEDAFTKMDANGDGALSKEEMKEARDKMHEKMKKMKEKHEKPAEEMKSEDSAE